jgi:hypothetical protein
MSRLLISKKLRMRLSYTAMSLLLVWHTLAMVVAPAPGSAITQPARLLLHPYLNLFNLQSAWGFFAPDVPAGFKFQYIVEDATGSRHIFVPADDLNVLLPTRIWFLDRYKAVMENDKIYAAATVASLCQKHAALDPVVVTLIGIDQKKFLFSDWQSGKRPFDPEFIETSELKPIRCPGK